jgi:hypothetical protein
MKDRPHQIAYWAVLAAPVLLLGACQGPDTSATPPRPDSAAGPALSAEQARVISGLEPLLRRSSQGLAVTEDASGGQKLNLQGGFQHAVIAQMNPDGTHSIICTDSIESATEFLARPPQAQVEEK